MIAPALSKALGGLHTHIDYIAFVSVGTVGLLVPLAAIFAGLSVIVDRHGGAQKELLAAPIPRGMLVLSNLVVVLALAAFQVIMLIAVAALRGASFHVSTTGVLWFLAASVLFTVFMYGSQAWLSLGVVVLFAAAFITLAIRLFKRSAVS